MHTELRREEAKRLDHKYYGQISYRPDIYDKYRHKKRKTPSLKKASVVSVERSKPKIVTTHVQPLNLSEHD